MVQSFVLGIGFLSSAWTVMAPAGLSLAASVFLTKQFQVSVWLRGGQCSMDCLTEGERVHLNG